MKNENVVGDTRRVYQALLQYAEGLLCNDSRSADTFVCLITGLLKSQNSALPEWITHRQSEAQFAQSRERQARRVQVFQEGVRLHQDVTMGACTREQYTLQGEGFTLRLDDMLKCAPLKSKANERLRRGILKHKVLEWVWRFLKDPDILPTNNAAEQSLRTVVMPRKVSQFNKNALGA
ncbi:IS66 family transposase [Deinococcus sp. UYEF24]